MVARVHNFLRHQRSVLAVAPASSPKAICEAWCTEKFIRTARRTVRRGPRSGPSSVWKRSTIIESSSRAARKSMMGIETVTRIQQTRSRDPCRTSRLCRRPCHCFASSSLPPGSKWPKRHRSLSEPLRRPFRTHFGSAEPRAQPQRSKWLHGSPAESVMLGGCRLLQPSTQNLEKTTRDTLPLGGNGGVRASPRVKRSFD